MGKRFTLSIAAGFFALVTAYLVGAFVAADFDITAWDFFGRFMVACLAIPACAAAAIFAWEATS